MRSLKVLAILLVASLSSGAFAQGLPRDVRIDILSAVVQIVPWDDQAEDLVGWSGSGTIISPSGYVLTNYHVAGDLELRQHYDWHVIYWTDPEFTDQPPEPMFWARYVAGDPTHDLALLKIEEWIDEEPISPDLVFPHVTVGDSNKLLPGDPITIVGYPGISGATITFTFGLMSGWLGEDLESGGKQWIKTDGKISHGNSGGGAFDESGHLIGVPTAGRTVQWEELDVEEQAYVRPISLAWALIGPHVADVARAGAGPVATAPAGGTSASTAQQPATEPQNPLAGLPQNPLGATPVASACDFCYVGDVSIGQSVSNAIGGLADAVNYHTYTIQVPAGTSSLVIDLSADSDLDLAVKYGQEIENWANDGDWEFRDISEANGGSFTISNPRAGTWYVDVIYFYETGSVNYSLGVR